MKKTLLVSLAAATLLINDASAASMYDRFEAMEKEMNQLKAELAALKTKESATAKEGMQKGDDEEEEDEGKPAVSKSSDKEDDEDEAEPIDEKLADMQENIDELNKRTGGNHL